MKFKYLLTIAAASLLAAVGCQKSVDLGPAKLELKGQNTITVPVEGQEFEVNFISTVDWGIQADTYTDDIKAWVSIDPTNGKASANEQVVKIKVKSNSGNLNRKATITIWGGVKANADITIEQKGDKVVVAGDGTKEKPYSASEAKAKAASLSADEKIENVYVKGIISSISNIDTGDFGNAEYCISDDGTTTDEFIIYRGKGLGGAKFTSQDDIKVGDNVIVVGTIKNYGGSKPEMDSGSKIVKLNDKEAEGGQGGDSGKIGTPAGTGTEADPFNVAAVITKHEKSGVSDDKIFVKGILVEIKNLPESKYNSGDFYIADASDEAKLYIYHCKNIGGGTFASENDLKIGDVLVIQGRIAEYNGALQIGGPTLISVNGNSDSPSQPGEGGTEDEVEGFSISLGEKSYEQEAVINETTTKVWKIGTSSDKGTIYVNVPAGTKKLSFSAVSWTKKGEVEVSFTPEGGEAKTIIAKENEGASGNPVYTITADETANYSIELDCEKQTKITVTTPKAGRVIFWNFIAE